MSDKDDESNSAMLRGANEAAYADLRSCDSVAEVMAWYIAMASNGVDAIKEFCEAQEGGTPAHLPGNNLLMQGIMYNLMLMQAIDAMGRALLEREQVDGFDFLRFHDRLLRRFAAKGGEILDKAERVEAAEELRDTLKASAKRGESKPASEGEVAELEAAGLLEPVPVESVIGDLPPAVQAAIRKALDSGAVEVKVMRQRKPETLN